MRFWQNQRREACIGAACRCPPASSGAVQGSGAWEGRFRNLCADICDIRWKSIDIDRAQICQTREALHAIARDDQMRGEDLELLYRGPPNVPICSASGRDNCERNVDGRDDRFRTMANRDARRNDEKCRDRRDRMRTRTGTLRTLSAPVSRVAEQVEEDAPLLAREISSDGEIARKINPMYHDVARSIGRATATRGHLWRVVTGTVIYAQSKHSKHHCKTPPL
jgi:hypothetical protein